MAVALELRRQDFSPIWTQTFLVNCRSMIPQVRNLAIECSSLGICFSCLTQLSYVLKFGPVQLAEDPLVAIAKNRSDIHVVYVTSWGMPTWPKVTEEDTNDSVHNVVLIRYNSLNDCWRPQHPKLCLSFEEELNLWKHFHRRFIISVIC